MNQPFDEYLELPTDVEASLVASARCTKPVSGLTHDFYKYPARFSPTFVRAAIEAFTKPGDLCLDPHVGGGTTLVEALASGRHAVGVDVSTLAEFVTKTKCIVYRPSELSKLEAWVNYLPYTINLHKKSQRLSIYRDMGYYRHLDNSDTWRLRKAIEQSLASASHLESPRLEAFGRCVVLRTAQWALDGRAKPTTIDDFRANIQLTASHMLEGARLLYDAVQQYGSKPHIRVLNRTAAGIETRKYLQKNTPKLVITSPPYPGIHILYHRWQVDGRKETPLPFMIANKLDGAGASYYTMGDRKNPGLKTYFDNIHANLSSVAKLAGEHTIVVQMIAFSDASWQLLRYLDVMSEVGLTELFLPSLQKEGDGRLWRSVPNRRWYSNQRGDTPGSQEVVLFHKLSRPHVMRSSAVSSARLNREVQ